MGHELRLEEGASLGGCKGSYFSLLNFPTFPCKEGAGRGSLGWGKSYEK